MLDTKARSASASRPRSHSATARYPPGDGVSSRSPSRLSARAREANAAVASASPRSWARRPRRSAISAGTFTSRLRARPTVGSNGSSAAPAYACSAASSSGSTASSAAAVASQERLRQQQPGPGPDQVIGQRRKPPLNRRPFAAQVEDRVEVLLDQPGGPGHLPGGDRVPDRVIGQPTLRVPGGRVTVQFGNPAGLFVPAGGRGAGRRTGGGSATSRAPHPAAPRTAPPVRPAPAAPGCQAGR